MCCNNLGSPFRPNLGGFTGPQMGIRYARQFGGMIWRIKTPRQKKRRPKAALEVSWMGGGGFSGLRSGHVC